MDIFASCQPYTQKLIIDVKQGPEYTTEVTTRGVL